jgi:hypothetical protein
MSAVSGSDGASNAYAAGYTGTVTAFQPGSSPTAVETWHNVTPPSGWSGVNRYKKLAESTLVCIDFELSATAGSGNVTIMTLPTGYVPATTHNEPMIFTASTGADTTTRIVVNTSGVVQTFSLPTGTTNIGGTIIFPTD